MNDFVLLAGATESNAALIGQMNKASQSVSLGSRWASPSPTSPSASRLLTQGGRGALRWDLGRALSECLSREKYPSQGPKHISLYSPSLSIFCLNFCSSLLC